MQNFVQAGNTITVIAPADLRSGDGVLVKEAFGIATYEAKFGESLEIVVEGVFTLSKAVGLIPQGARVYWDNGAKNVTTVPQGNTLVGIATADATDPDPTVNVRLNGSF